jgi:hypothetical protein
MIVGDEVDDAMERLHADIMEFGQALRDRIYLPGTWTLRQGATSTDGYRFYTSAWEPFLREWLNFRSLKRDVPLQTLPFSGTASLLRSYRERFVQLLTQAKQQWLLTGTGYVPPQWARVGGWVDIVGRRFGGRRTGGYYGDRHRRY